MLSFEPQYTETELVRWVENSLNDSFTSLDDGVPEEALICRLLGENESPFLRANRIRLRAERAVTSILYDDEWAKLPAGERMVPLITVFNSLPARHPIRIDADVKLAASTFKDPVHLKTERQKNGFLDDLSDSSMFLEIERTEAVSFIDQAEFWELKLRRMFLEYWKR